MTDTIFNKTTCAVEREHQAEQWTPSLLPITCPPAISSHFHVSLLPVPWRYLQLTVAAIAWHNLLLETGLIFWKSKGKQTLRTQTKILDRRRGYIDLAAYFSFNGTCIQSQLEEKSWKPRMNHEKIHPLGLGNPQPPLVSWESIFILLHTFILLPQEEAMSLAAGMQLILYLQNKTPRGSYFALTISQKLYPLPWFFFFVD